MSRTTAEGTRLPKEMAPATSSGRLDRDEANNDYVLVQDVIRGVDINPMDIASYKAKGYEIVSEDPRETGHGSLVLMARPKERGEAEREARSKKDNAMYGAKPLTEEEVRAGMLSKEGLLTRSKPFSSGELEATLPSAAEMHEREEAAESLAL